MTEYATTPSAIEEWKTQRNRTADWVQQVGVSAAGLPLAPSTSTSTDSDWDKRSLWDGNGWEAPSDCESSTSIPPTMMLQYADSRNVVVTPTTQQAEGSPRKHNRGRGDGHGHAAGRSHMRDHTRREEDRTEMGRSRTSQSADRGRNLNPTSSSKASRDAGGPRSRTSSARHLARTAAAPLPDSHSSHSVVSAIRSRSKSKSRKDLELDAEAEAEVVNSASHRATSTHSHPSRLLENRAQSKEPQQSLHPPSQHDSRMLLHHPSQTAASHPPSHSPAYQASHQASQQDSHPPSRVPAHPPTHQSAHAPSHQVSQQQPPSQNAPSHAASQRPSHVVPSHVPSHSQSHKTSTHPSVQPNHSPAAFSNHTVAAPLGFDNNPAATPANPSANGTGIGNSAVASHPPPSIHSIQSRSISVSESRSSGQQPEPIVVYPPINSPPRSNSNSQTNGISNANGMQPHSTAASASLSYVSVPPRQPRTYDPNEHIQHGHQQRQSVVPSQYTSHSHSHSYQNQSQTHGQAVQVHTPNGQLPTPISPTGYASAVRTGQHRSSGPMRAPSTMSATGIGGGYVLVDLPSPGFEGDMERELAERNGYENGKGSGGDKNAKERERASLFNVFGVKKQNRSKSLPLSGTADAMPAVEEEKERRHESSADHRDRPTYAQNPYLTPISPLSPTSPQHPTAPGGADADVNPSNPFHSPPPKIVYAPARHHSATHFSPPRIMYVPASPRKGQRLAPYDTQQNLHPHILPTGTQAQEHRQGGQERGIGIMGLGQGQTFLYPHPYPSMATHSSQYPYAYSYHQQYGHGAAAALGSKGPGSPGSIRGSQTLQEPVRDSGWEEGPKRHDQDESGRGEISGGNAAREDNHGANADAHEHISTPVALSPNANLHGDGNVALASPAESRAGVAVVAPSDATRTSQRTNMAGVGTVSARSRSRGRESDATPRITPGSPSHLAERVEHEVETERGRSRERSQSRAHGMVYSASAPQPEMHRRSVAPYAAMMVPPGSTLRDRGVRDAPYPTPPGSASEHFHHQQMHDELNFHEHVDSNGGYPNGHNRPHKTVRSPISPDADVTRQPLGGGGLVSRFRGMHRSSHPPNSPRAVERDAPSSSPARGRTVERDRERVKDGASHRRPYINGNGRARSVESQVSGSSASTYYVISTPGQKVRLIRTDGKPATATSSEDRGPSGGAGSWFKKAGTALRPRFLSRDIDQHSPHLQSHRDEKSSPRTRTHSQVQAPALESRSPSGGSGVAASTKSGKKGKLIRRSSTSSTTLLPKASSREPSQGQSGGAVERTDVERDVDIVIPGR